jgi:peptidoglycan hydrolase-like protein with peptidoglycan-binding domain
MKRSTLRTALMIATIAAPLWGASTWADDAHHPAPGAAATQTPSTPTPAPTSVALSESTIKALQEALNKQGIAVKVDGVLSDETRAAIRKYQTEHHLSVTGEPDKATLDKLGVAVSAPPAAAQGQPGQAPQPPRSGGMMMECPMMQGQMQGMMQMMQTMQGQMQEMQRMMQAMQRQMQPGQAQPGAK